MLAMVSDGVMRDRDTLDWPHREASRTVRVGTIDWHVQMMGPDDAPCLLLVHGTGASTHSWRGLMPLMARDHLVVAVDLPGHAFTRGARAADLTLPGMARALEALLAVLGLSPDLACGHSAGAAILLELGLGRSFRPRRIFGVNAALEPIRGNALLSPLAKVLFNNPLTSQLVSLQARMINVSDQLLRATGSAIDRQGRECYAVLLRRPAHVSGAIGMMAGWDLVPLVARLPRLSVPVTLIASRDDPMVPARVSENAARLVPDCRLDLFERGGHLFHEVDPNRMASLLRRQTAGTA